MIKKKKEGKGKGEGGKVIKNMEKVKRKMSKQHREEREQGCYVYGLLRCLLPATSRSRLPASNADIQIFKC